MTPINPDTVLAAKLEAQQWNVVIAGLGELPHKLAGPIEKLLLDQLQPPPEQTIPAGSNGVDKHPIVQGDYDPVPRPPPGV